MNYNKLTLSERVCIIIRAHGERTEDLCRHLAEDQIDQSKVIVVHEKPFSKALRQSFQVAIELGTEWTICLDADVLLNENAIEKCMNELDTLLPHIFKAQPRLICKFHGAKLAAGFHIYRTSLLKKGIKYIPSDSKSLRPETAVLRGMIKEGYSIAHLDVIGGIHEYELFYADIYRRMRLRGTKGGIYEHNYLLTRFKQNKGDLDNIVAERALIDSKKFPLKIHSINAIKDEDIKVVLKELGLEEKEPLNVILNYDIVKKVISEFSPDSKALQYTKLFNSKNFPYKNVKILLISSASIGPLYISSLLKKEGFIVKKLYQGYKKYLGEPTVPFLPPISETMLREFNPDIIGFSIDTSTFKDSIEMVSEIKKLLPNVYIVFGGPHPTICPDETIQANHIDAICIGEGEYAMLELCNHIRNQQAPIKVKNLWVNHNGKIFKNSQRSYIQDLDSIPLDRDGITYGGIYTGRGCYGQCTFCNIPTIRENGPEGKYFRKRSIESVLKEIQIVFKNNIGKARLRSGFEVIAKFIGFKQLIGPFSSYKGFISDQQGLILNFAKYLDQRFPFIFNNIQMKLASILGRIFSYKKHVEPVRFKDDTFLANRSWFLKMAKKISVQYPNITYICQARANEINKKVAYWLKKSGCVCVSLGFETGSETLRNDLLHKNVSDKQITYACALLRKYGIRIMGQWMYGLPDETFIDSIKTLIMSIKEGDFSQLHFATPLPGTELFDIAVKKGVIDSKFYSDGLYSSSVFHKGESRLHVLLISLIHVLKDVQIPKDYKFIRYLGSKSVWRGKTIGNVIAEELLNEIKNLDNK